MSSTSALTQSPQVWTIFKSGPGDQNIVKQITLYDSAGDPKDLTDFEPRLVVWKQNPALPYFVDEDLEVVGDPTLGVLQWTVTQDEVQDMPISLDGLIAQVVLLDSGSSIVDSSYYFTIIVMPGGSENA